MANEITLNISGSLLDQTTTPARQLDSIPLMQLLVTQVTRGGDSVIVPVTTSDQVIAPAVATYGYAFLQNLDADNFIDYGPASGGSLVVFGVLYPGEWALVRLKPAMILRARADTATSDLLVKVWGN